MASTVNPVDHSSRSRATLAIRRLTINLHLARGTAVDLRADVPALDVLLYIFRDEHERAGNVALADEWLAIVGAPQEQVFTYETIDGESWDVLFVRYNEVERILVGTILPETYP